MHRNLLGLMLCLLLTTAYAHDSPAHITAANTPAIEAITTLADASHSSGESPSPSDADSGTSESKDDLASKISDQVHDFLEQQARTLGLEATIKVNPPRVENLGVCEDFEVYSRSKAQLRSRMTVSVRCHAPTQWVTHVHAQLSASGYYFVANRTIEADEPVTLDDLIAHEADVLKLSPHILTDPSKIIGHIATRRIPNGTTLRANSLRNPQSIARGQTVQTIARGQGFVVTSEGQALQSGNPGARIQVRTASGQVIQAIVLDAHTVEVFLH
ncbi:MAG TPA: flagellar basal body P-ring formation chaperone FlgA [Paenalcaligenes sp.]|nr:flagellar basal body P-ring formation chaperone FlgA [Paenalcaligenes sp.]